VAIYQWIKALGKEGTQIKRHAAHIVERDEQHGYVEHQKTLAGPERLLINLANASSMQSLNTMMGAHREPDDCCRHEKQFVPSETHMQSKAETFTVESDKRLFRHFLSRFRWKTKCDSKSETMWRYSVMLLMAKWNGELEYIGI